MKSAPPQKVEGIYRRPSPLNLDKRSAHIKSTLESKEPLNLIEAQGEENAQPLLRLVKELQG